VLTVALGRLYYSDSACDEDRIVKGQETVVKFTGIFPGETDGADAHSLSQKCFTMPEQIAA
jgi:hypothetical protein